MKPNRTREQCRLFQTKRAMARYYKAWKRARSDDSGWINVPGLEQRARIRNMIALLQKNGIHSAAQAGALL